MRAASHRYGDGAATEELWGIAGLLHDADYDQWPEEHPKRICAWLNARGHDDLAHAISAHYTHWGVTWETPMDKALLACDELTGFVMACCYVRPEGITTLTPKSSATLPIALATSLLLTPGRSLRIAASPAVTTAFMTSA